jgi:hypothetical protein
MYIYKHIHDTSPLILPFVRCVAAQRVAMSGKDSKDTSPGACERELPGHQGCLSLAHCCRPPSSGEPIRHLYQPHECQA